MFNHESHESSAANPVRHHPGVPARVGYVVKRYPRFSETFVVNEILAHEAAGLDVEIFSLKPPVDTHFQNVISEVRGPVCYLNSESVKAGAFWRSCYKLAGKFPQLWPAITNAPFAEVTDVAQAVELASKVRERKIGHLHAHFATSAATVAQLAARIADISYSVTMHAKDIFHESVIPDELQNKIEQARFVITVSDFNRHYLVSNYGCSEKIHRVYNGLDLELFDYRPRVQPSRSILAVGRFVPKKGFRYLIEACRILLDRGVPYECEIVGSGELESLLRQQILDLSLENHVRMPGPQPQNVVREMIRGAAVMAAPCIVGDDGNRDGLPTVITEAMALGTPCVATDVTGIPEIVRSGENGCIVAQENPEELANELQNLLDNEALRRAFAVNGRRLVEQEFDAQRNVARIRDLFPGTKSTPRAPHALEFQRV